MLDTEQTRRIVQMVWQRSQSSSSEDARQAFQEVLRMFEVQAGTKIEDLCPNINAPQDTPLSGGYEAEKARRPGEIRESVDDLFPERKARMAQAQRAELAAEKAIAKQATGQTRTKDDDEADKLLSKK